MGGLYDLRRLRHGGTVNAVNLTDGIDGLATGVTIPVALFYVAVSAWFNRSDLTVVSAAWRRPVRLSDL